MKLLDVLIHKLCHASTNFLQNGIASRLCRDCSGQGTVEFAIVTAALLVIAIALGALLNMSDTGLLVKHAIMSASHNLSGAMAGIVGDLFCV